MLVGDDHVEPTLPVLEGLLVQAQDHSPCHAVQDHPRPIAWVLGLEEVEEDVS